jgi:hypothetical protein
VLTSSTDAAESTTLCSYKVRNPHRSWYCSSVDLLDLELTDVLCKTWVALSRYFVMVARCGAIDQMELKPNST